MPLYSQILSDNYILKMMKPEYKKISLLGCGGCMNESLAFLHSTPIIIHNEEDTFPSIENECNRLVKMLTYHGFFADTIILPPGKNVSCIRNVHNREFFLPENFSSDAILVLSCPSGYWGLSKYIKNIPMYNITKPSGALHYKYFDNGKERIIVYGKLCLFSDEQ